MLPLPDHVAPYLAAPETDAARQVVNFHTGFNLALAVLFLPLLDPVASALQRILPEEERREDSGQPRYLDDGAVDTPSEKQRRYRERLKAGKTLPSAIESPVNSASVPNAGVAVVHPVPRC